MRAKITYDPGRDYYEILRVPPNAGGEQIRQAYRARVRDAHPDLNPDRQEWATDQLQLLNEAYSVLADPPLRREYDRARWPHVPHEAELNREYRSPYDTAHYDFDQPWWEQVATSTYAFGGKPMPGVETSDPASAPEQAAWERVTDWLRAHRLGWMARLWRRPYSFILTVLATLLALDAALIIYITLSPQEWDDITAWLEARARYGSASSRVVASPSPAPPPLRLDCVDPGAQITAPVTGDAVTGPFPVIGTAQNPDMWAYRLEIGYLGTEFAPTRGPDQWIEVRSPPRNQSIAEPAIEQDLLTDSPVDLDQQASGYYALRLRVVLRNGHELPACDVVVRR